MTSPYITQPTSVNALMLGVLGALIPAIGAYVYFFGPAILVSLLLASVTALLCEAAMLKIRRYAAEAFLVDGSALVTAWLLALSMPPLAPWWLVVVGTAFAIVVAKHLYGGLGSNLFNPAMVGYAVMIVSFPVPMTHWAAPETLAAAHLSFAQDLRYIFAGILPDHLKLDAVTMATPLDTLRTQLKLAHTLSEIRRLPIFGTVGGIGSQTVALMYLLGGLYLLSQRVITWHIPVAMGGALALASAVLHGIDADHYASPAFELFTGGAMIGAFFIATDPVTAPTTPKGKLLFGAGVGVLTYCIRTFGGYPDGVAFAVLLMNMTAPLLDAYTQPRVFGHAEKETPRGTPQ